MLLTPEERVNTTVLWMQDQAEREHIAEQNEWWRIHNGIDRVVFDAIGVFHSELAQRFRVRFEDLSLR